MLEVGRALADAVPVVLMCYANLVLARGAERFAAELAERGISGLIVPDMPLEEAGDVLAACDAAGVALVPLVAPTTHARAAGRDRPQRARLRLRGRGHRHDRRARGPRRTRWRRCSRGRRPARTCRSRSASASARRPAAAQVADAGADGVIVGSRLVRAAGEAPDPAAAVRELVTEFAAALR